MKCKTELIEIELLGGLHTNLTSGLHKDKIKFQMDVSHQNPLNAVKNYCRHFFYFVLLFFYFSEKTRADRYCM